VNVYVTFDVEVWCDGWADLDGRFPAAFQRYYFGRSEAGDYALPKTIEILDRHGLQGVFFVEPLFAARFGRQHLETVARLIADGGQDVQLHLHPEWTDEISPPLIADVSKKRQHLVHYDVDEQTALIAAGRRLLEQALGRPVDTFRAGSFAANRDTFRALARNGFALDSSLNAGYDYSAGSIAGVHDFGSERLIEGVRCIPVTVYRDGLGRRRPAQLNGSSFAELRSALLDAQARGVRHFVIVSHNFEMLKPSSNRPDWFVVRRFEALCRFLGEHRELFRVGPFGAATPAEDGATETRPQVPLWATAGRLVQQVARRFA
jgi:hypothetical protein